MESRPPPQAVFDDELRPLLEEAGARIAASDLTPDHRAGLALAALVYLAGTARAAFRSADVEIDPEEIGALVEMAISDDFPEQEFS